MNIKGFFNNITPLESLQRTVKSKEVRSEESAQDRDADGRRERDSKPQKDQLTQEEVGQVIAAIKDLEGIKVNNLLVRVEYVDTRAFFIVAELNGKLVRRLNSAEGWSIYLSHTSTGSGQLLNKAL